MLEGQQTDVTHSVFTTSPTASECITAVPAGRDQERKPNLGMFNMILAAETSIFKCGLCPELQFLGWREEISIHWSVFDKKETTLKEAY